MNLIRLLLKYYALPSFKNAWNLVLNLPAHIEKSSHSIHKIVYIFQLFHKFLLRKKLYLLYHFTFAVQLSLYYDQVLKFKYAANMPIQNAIERLDLVTQAGENFIALSFPTNG